MKKLSGFSLMEMMVVLLIVSIVAAASAPMVNKKLLSNASEKSPWVWTGVNNNIAYNLNNAEQTASIGTTNPPAAASNAKLYIDTKAGSNGVYRPQISFGQDGGKNVMRLTSTGNSIWLTNTPSTNALSSVVIGDSANASGTYSTALGCHANASRNFATALGRSANASGLVSIAIGNCTSSSNTNTTALGNYAAASGYASTALGNFAHASSGNSSALGNYTTASAGNSTALGTYAKSSGISSTAIGSCSNASGSGSTALGNYANASGTNSIAIGNYARATGTSSTALGKSAYATGWSSTALGEGAYASGTDSTALGYDANAAYSRSTAIGRNAKTTASNQIMLGTIYDTVVIPGEIYIPGTLTIDNLVVNKFADIGRTLESNRCALKVRAGIYDHNGIKLPNGHLRDEPSYDYLYTCKYDNGYITVSDRRLKNVGKAFTSGLDKIKKLEVFNYTLKDDKDKTPHVGVMAQDLQKIFPNAVIKGEDGFLRIRMEDMFYALINAVKELDSKIEIMKKEDIMSLKSQVDSLGKANIQLSKQNLELQKKIAGLEKRIADLEKKIK